MANEYRPDPTLKSSVWMLRVLLSASGQPACREHDSPLLRTLSRTEPRRPTPRRPMDGAPALTGALSLPSYHQKFLSCRITLRERRIAVPATRVNWPDLNDIESSALDRFTELVGGEAAAPYDELSGQSPVGVLELLLPVIDALVVEDDVVPKARTVLMKKAPFAVSWLGSQPVNVSGQVVRRWASVASR